MPVQEHCGIVIFCFFFLCYTFCCSISVQYILCPHTQTSQDLAGAFTRRFLVVHHQHRKPCQRIHIRLRDIIEFQINLDREPGPFSQGALHPYVAVHHTGNVHCNGHPKTSPFDLAGAGIRRTGKGLEDLLDIVFLHADACIFKGKLVISAACDVRSLFFDLNTDPASGRRKFDRISHNVHEDLLQPLLVPDHILMLQSDNIHLQPESLRLHLRMEHRQQALNGIRQIKAALRQTDFAALDPTHIQDLINQSQQMFAGDRDLAQRIQYPFLFVNVHPRHGCHTQNRIHGRTDIMAHPGQEIALGQIRSLCPFCSQHKHLLLLLLPVNDLINAAHSQCNCCRSPILRLCHRDGGGTPLIPAILPHPLILELHMILGLQVLQYIGQVQKFPDLFPIFFLNDPQFKTAGHKFPVVVSGFRLHAPVRIKHLISASFYINVIDCPIRPRCPIHGILIDAVPLRHLIPFLCKDLIPFFMPVIPDRLKEDNPHSAQNDQNAYIIEKVKPGEDLILRYGQNCCPAIVHMMKIDVARNTVHCQDILQDLVVRLKVHMLQKTVDPLLIILIPAVQRRLIVEQRPLPVNQIIGSILRQHQSLVVLLEAGKHHINRQKTAGLRNCPAHGNHRQPRHHICIRRRDIDPALRIHGPLIIVLVRHREIGPGFDLRDVGHCLSHRSAVHLDLILTVYLCQTIHKGIQPLSQLFHRDILLLPFLNIIDADTENRLAGPYITLLCQRIIFHQRKPHLVGILHQGSAQNPRAEHNHADEHNQHRKIVTHFSYQLSLIAFPHAR